MLSIIAVDKITLKRDWDYQPKLGDSRGYHIVRAEEHRALVDFLTRRDEGSMLVCGNRGVGKTSSIITAVNDAKNSRKKLIPVLIKATSIHFTEKIEKNISLLRGLVHSLYRTVKDNTSVPRALIDETKDLLERSLATQSYAENLSNKVAEKSATLNVNLALFLSALIAGSIIYLSGFEALYWIPLGMGVGAVLSLIYKTQTKRSRSSLQYYRHDQDFSDLLSKFEDLMKSYSNAKYKIVFILDEFDKNNDLNIVSSLKMLINQGNALFIFVTDPQKMNALAKKRTSSYTLFSQILFLKRPLFQDMEKFIDQIVDSTNTGIKSKPEYRAFRNYLCYKSQTDFFDIYRVIRDHMIGVSSDGRPMLNIALDTNQIVKANLQKSIGWVYARKKRNALSGQQINDEMIDALYDILDKMETNNLSEITVDRSLTFAGPPPRPYEKHQISAVQDLFVLLTKQGYVTTQDENRYHKVGILPKFTAAGIFVEEQKTFMETFKTFVHALVDSANIYKKWIVELGEPFRADAAELHWEKILTTLQSIYNFEPYYSQAKVHYEQLRSDDPPLIKTEDLEQATLGIREAHALLERHSTDLLARILEKRFDAPVTFRNDISAGFFSRIGLPNQDIHNATLNFEQRSAKIKEIAIVHSPKYDFLNTHTLEGLQNRLKGSHRNMIICLGGPTYFNRVNSSLFTKDVASLRKKIENSPHFSKVAHSFKHPPDPSTSQDGWHDTFFFAVKTPLDNRIIQDLIDVIEEYFA